MESNVTNNVIEYLEFLDPSEFKILYQDNYSCLSIYRSFDLFGQYLIRTMLYCGDKIWDIGEIQKLLVQKNPISPNLDPKVICSNTLRKMFKLYILIKRQNVKTFKMKMNDLFRNNLMIALSQFNVLPYDRSEQAIKKERSFRKLEQYAKEKWEEILYYMVDQIDVDSTYIPERERSTAKKLIHEAGLLKQKEEEDEDEQDDEEGSTSSKITSVGFRFLLLDLKSQIWLLLQQYMVYQDQLRQNNEQYVNRVEIIKFLFMLSYLQVGRVYHKAQLNKFQQYLMIDLSEFGILRMNKDRFYVTPLAIEFSKTSHQNAFHQSSSNFQSRPPPSPSSPSSKQQQNRLMTSRNSSTSSNWRIPDLHGPVIVQTNFKVYAYTNSPIQIALLRLFCELEYRLPNLVVGSIERITVRAALVNGITADQIIGYLYMHAHEKCKTLSKGPPVPTNVTNQIRLWERERNRIHAEKALFYYEIKDEATFKKLVAYADSRQCMLYVNWEKMYLVTRDTPEIEKSMEQYAGSLK